jgi:hypothetical protein
MRQAAHLLGSENFCRKSMRGGLHILGMAMADLRLFHLRQRRTRGRRVWHSF